MKPFKMSIIIITAFFALLISFNSVFAAQIASSTWTNNVHYLHQGDLFKFEPKVYGPREFHVFCYEGKPKYIIHIWQSVLLKIQHSTDDYTHFDGATPDQVKNEYDANRYSWTVNFFPINTKQKSVRLDPFNSSCIGIDSKDAYSVQLNVIRVDLWKLLNLAIGILLFLSANSLSKNTYFHYISGICFGICASFMILIYFISKMFPRKPLMYGVLGCGWTIVIYFLQIVLDNLKVILSTYQAYVIWYTVITGVISFILCYRWGPVENQRTKNLIKWSLQLAGLVLIYFSSHFKEAAMGQIVLLLVVHFMPKKWVAVSKSYWLKKFPPKVNRLTDDEYYQQGVLETSKALEELRIYCSSPKCNQWKTVLKLKDVKRFASFVEGNSHLSDDEILEYETSIQGDLTDDDEEEDSNELSEEEAVSNNYYRNSSY